MKNIDYKHIVNASIFPAFGTEYFGSEKALLSRLGYDIHDYIARASSIVEIEGHLLDRYPDGYFPNELQSQYFMYIYSCAFSDAITSAGIPISYCAGYSMGIYAALYHCGSCTFETGLDLIKMAYTLITEASQNFDFAMGVIVGLEYEDVYDIIEKQQGQVEIINVNNKHSFTIAGLRQNVAAVIESCNKDGALNARVLPMGLPYHSKYMNNAARKFDNYCKQKDIKDPRMPLISTIDQCLVQTREDIICDLHRNINNNINWDKTMSMMVSHGVNCFYECGPGRSLQKLAKFIDGNFIVQTIKKLPSLIPVPEGAAK